MHCVSPRGRCSQGGFLSLPGPRAFHETLEAGSIGKGRADSGLQERQAHAQNRQGQAARGKGGKRVSWEIFVGFGTRDLKATEGHSVYFRRRSCFFLLGPGNLGTSVKPKVWLRMKVNSRDREKECKCHICCRQRSW